MAIRSDKNEYHGVNAHLNSFLQNIILWEDFYDARDWEGFHGKHIGDIAESLSAIMPAGYLISTETSLQIREIYPDTGKITLTRPDITIHDTQSLPTTKASGLDGASLTRPLIEALYDVEEDYYTAIVILEEDGSPFGRPITRIELLSPSNKIGRGYAQYHQKRLATLKAGVSLIEIDYLHETPPTLNHIPSYSDRQTGAFPYHISISQPIPSFERGTSATYGFFVDDPIPTIPIPLSENQHVTLNLNVVYQKTFMSINLYRHLADYSVLPAHFDSYLPDDQARIQAIMTQMV
ncbi:MAG TPA: DUF4058 family protein [Aggregatilineales bacterium]|nr:DUF4058 family protein [Aggregatilineales bacterium]